jgi:chitinase
MRQQIKRRIGQILIDGGFVSNREIDHALDEQKHTKELLGQVLVKIGVIKERDFRVPLIVQQHLNHIEDAVEIAAGERELLGALLVHSGHITTAQLDHAIAEQKRTGEKLGEVFVRLGMLQERQLNALLDFQKHQGEATRGPLRLGELLVATGHISRKQLNNAIRKQTISHKKIGEVLVDEGYVRPSHVKYGICLQRMLVGSVLSGIISLGMGGKGFASNVVLQWDQSSEADVSGYRVYESSDLTPLKGAVPIDVQNQTTATAYAWAKDAAGNVSGSRSASVNITVPDAVAPAVALSGLVAGSTVGGSVTITAIASDNVGVSRVELYVNGLLKATDTSSTYTFSLDTTSLANGPKNGSRRC